MNHTTDKSISLLTDEDRLRLNVLLTQADAVRIDAPGPTVVGLAGDRELRVALHPRGREDAYLLAVKRLLATLVIGHPGGFPVHISRWLRGGPLAHLKVADLLRLGEPEAVLAAAQSPGLDEAMARRAWWACPEAVVARTLLANAALGDTALHRELATELADHLPFESDDEIVMETLRLIALPGLLDPVRRRRLWQRGDDCPAYRVGFLMATDDLPAAPAAHPRLATNGALLAAHDHPLAGRLHALLSPPGQGFLAACDGVLAEPADREIISRLLNLLGSRCAVDGLDEALETDSIESLERRVDALLEEGGAVGRLAEALPGWRDELRALLMLAGATESLCYTVFARSSASGSLLRDKLADVLTPLREAAALLRGGRRVPPPPRRGGRRLSPSG